MFPRVLALLPLALPLRLVPRVLVRAPSDVFAVTLSVIVDALLVALVFALPLVVLFMFRLISRYPPEVLF